MWKFIRWLHLVSFCPFSLWKCKMCCIILRWRWRCHFHSLFSSSIQSLINILLFNHPPLFFFFNFSLFPTCFLLQLVYDFSFYNLLQEAIPIKPKNPSPHSYCRPLKSRSTVEKSEKPPSFAFSRQPLKMEGDYVEWEHFSWVINVLLKLISQPASRLDDIIK